MEWLWLLTVNTNTDFWSAVERLNGKQQLTINAILLQNPPNLSRGTRLYAFSRSTKHAKRSLPYSQDFSKICFRTVVILTVQQILLKRSISSKGHHQFLMDFIWIRTYDAFRAKSMFLIKSAIQYNNRRPTTDSAVALYGAHLHVITPRQYGY